jgi:hypothetical protein
MPEPTGGASTQGFSPFLRGTKRGPFTPSSTESRAAFDRGPLRATMSLPACLISRMPAGWCPFSIRTRAESTNGCREEPTSSSFVLSSLAWKCPGEVLIGDTRMTIGADWAARAIPGAVAVRFVIAPECRLGSIGACSEVCSFKPLESLPWDTPTSPTTQSHAKADSWRRWNSSNLPRLWRGRRGGGQSLSRGMGNVRRKSQPGLCLRETVSRQEFAALTETGSTLDGDWFESAKWLQRHRHPLH